MINRLLKNESGQDMIEYGMLAALLSIAAVTTLRLFAPIIIAFYNMILNAF